MRWIALLFSATLALIAGCSDALLTAPAAPDMSGGWQAVTGCVPAECVERLWARPHDDDRTRYTIADTVYRADGTISRIKSGDMGVVMDVWGGRLQISWSVTGTQMTQWQLVGTVARSGPVSEFSVTESIRFQSNIDGENVTQGPWTFRRIQP